MNKIDLENRLINFSVGVIAISDNKGIREPVKPILNQLVRSSSSAALNYGEAQGAESRRDFIHKLRISVKELRESLVSLKIIEKSNLLFQKSEIEFLLKECNELISILVVSIKTAEKNESLLKSQIRNKS